jgi:hypothetical protein
MKQLTLIQIFDLSLSKQTNTPTSEILGKGINGDGINPLYHTKLAYRYNQGQLDSDDYLILIYYLSRQAV